MDMASGVHVTFSLSLDAARLLQQFAEDDNKRLSDLGVLSLCFNGSKVVSFTTGDEPKLPSRSDELPIVPLSQQRGIVNDNKRHVNCAAQPSLRMLTNLQSVNVINRSCLSQKRGRKNYVRLKTPTTDIVPESRLRFSANKSLTEFNEITNRQSNDLRSLYDGSSLDDFAAESFCSYPSFAHKNFTQGSTQFDAIIGKNLDSNFFSNTTKNVFKEQKSDASAAFDRCHSKDKHLGWKSLGNSYAEPCRPNSRPNVKRGSIAKASPFLANLLKNNVTSNDGLAIHAQHDEERRYDVDERWSSSTDIEQSIIVPAPTKRRRVVSRCSEPSTNGNNESGRDSISLCVTNSRSCSQDGATHMPVILERKPTSITDIFAQTPCSRNDEHSWMSKRMYHNKPIHERSEMVDALSPLELGIYESYNGAGRFHCLNGNWTNENHGHYRTSANAENGMRDEILNGYVGAEHKLSSAICTPPESPPTGSPGFDFCRTKSAIETQQALQLNTSFDQPKHHRPANETCIIADNNLPSPHRKQVRKTSRGGKKLSALSDRCQQLGSGLFGGIFNGMFDDLRRREKQYKVDDTPAYGFYSPPVEAGDLCLSPHKRRKSHSSTQATRQRCNFLLNGDALEASDYHQHHTGMAGTAASLCSSEMLGRNAELVGRNNVNSQLQTNAMDFKMQNRLRKMNIDDIRYSHQTELSTMDIYNWQHGRYGHPLTVPSSSSAVLDGSELKNSRLKAVYCRSVGDNGTTCGNIEVPAENLASGRTSGQREKDITEYLQAEERVQKRVAAAVEVCESASGNSGWSTIDIGAQMRASCPIKAPGILRSDAVDGGLSVERDKNDNFKRKRSPHFKLKSGHASRALSSNIYQCRGDNRKDSHVKKITVSRALTSGLTNGDASVCNSDADLCASDKVGKEVFGDDRNDTATLLSAAQISIDAR